MKRILTALLVVVAIATQGRGSLAEVEDFTEYQEVLARFSVDELRLMREIIDEEITRRLNEAGQGDEALHMTAGTVLINEENVLVTLTGNVEMHPSKLYFYLEAILENNRSTPVEGYISDVSINGWTVDSSGKFEARPGNKHKFHFTIFNRDASITRIDEIKEMVIRLSVYDANSHDRIIEKETISLVQ